MKKLLALTAIVFTAALPAADFRIDIVGNDNLSFAPGEVSENVTLGQAGWLGAKKDQRLCAQAKVSDAWREYSFSFTPKSSGKATIQLMSSDAKTFVACDNIRLTSGIPNGSFEQLRPDGTPFGWWKMRDARVIVGGSAADGRNYVLAAHNDRWTRQFDCTAGVPVTVKFSARREGK